MTMTEPTLAYGEDSWDYLLRTWQEMDVPEGFRAEIREGGIALVPPPGGPHNSIAYQILKQLTRAIPDDWEVHQTSGVAVPHLERLRIPDLVVVPRDAVALTPVTPLDVTDVLLAVEIISPSSQKEDRVTKKAEYAQGGIPLYLLVDPYDGRGTVTLFTDPMNGRYARSHRTGFGTKVVLPKPFDMDLETRAFPLPE